MSDMEWFRDELDRHGTRLDEHQRYIIALQEETTRTRERLHRMEGDRSAVRALVKTTQKLADQTLLLAAQVKTGAAQAEELVEAAAERAVVKAYGRRTENRWKLITRLASALAALAAFGSLLAYLFVH